MAGHESEAKMSFIDVEDDNNAALIDELNHRLFNTLQVISSSLHQFERHKEPDALRASLFDLKVRIDRLGALHKLLASGPVDGLQNHCLALCQLLVCAFGAENVTPRVKLEDYILSPPQEQRIALATVELATNVLKHSLVGGMSGSFSVHLRATPTGAELSASDSRGLPLKERLAPSRILQSLARGLDGKAFVEDRDGFTAGIRFPLRKPARDTPAAILPPRFNHNPILYI
jgi:two-component system, sensor histidine kinase PdtaS